MSKTVVLIGLSIVLLSTCFVSKRRIPAPMFPDSGCWGLVYHLPEHIPSYADEVPLLKDIGVRWVRLVIRWRDIEKGQKGYCDWTSADEVILPYLGRNFKINYYRLKPIALKTEDRAGPTEVATTLY